MLVIECDISNADGLFKFKFEYMTKIFFYFLAIKRDFK